MTALVVALTGTDHHPFERMVRWIDEEAIRHSDVHFVIQYGASRPPSVAEGHDYLTHDRLMGMLAEASVVVCHGGPGTIMDAREAGHVPLCVPRDPRLGEHVDGHQQRFAAAVAGEGVIRAISSLDTFHHELDKVLAAPASLTASMAGPARDDARARIAAELDDLMAVRPPRLIRPRRSTR